MHAHVHRYTMLIKLLPQTLPVPKPEEAKHNRETPPVTSTTAWECSQLRQLADTLGVNMPRTEGANWISTFYTLLDQATVAVTVCDMSVPGLPLDYCNPVRTYIRAYMHMHMSVPGLPLDYCNPVRTYIRAYMCTCIHA